MLGGVFFNVVPKVHVVFHFMAAMEIRCLNGEIPRLARSIPTYIEVLLGWSFED